MNTNITKTGTWRRGFTFTANGTDVFITVEPMINGSNGRVRSYGGWIHNVEWVVPSTELNPKGKARIYLGNYKPEYKQMLITRLEDELIPKYMGPKPECEDLFESLCTKAAWDGLSPGMKGYPKRGDIHQQWDGSRWNEVTL